MLLPVLPLAFYQQQCWLDRKELQQALQQCAQAIGCKFQDFSNTTEKSLPQASQLSVMWVLIVLTIFVLINIVMLSSMEL